MPTPNSGTRPGSQTNSYVQSCASTMSGVDDRKLDEILGDGIQNQVCKKSFFNNWVSPTLQIFTANLQSLAVLHFPL